MSCRSNLCLITLLVGVTAILLAESATAQIKPRTEWGHWRLGHRNDLSFLQENRFTVTFAGGAPHFERVTRGEYDRDVKAAREQVTSYHDQGYIVLRYMTSSVHGTTATSEASPEAHLLDLYDFYHNGGWEAYEDYLGPKPPGGEDPSTWLTVRADGSFPYYRYAPYGQQTTGRFESWGCPNNPHFRKLMSARLRSQAETGVDGVYLDWTQIAGETCHCTHCREGFRTFLQRHLPTAAAERKYGMADYTSAPIPAERGDAFWMEWMEFRTHTLADFHRYLRKEARTVKDDFLLSGNVYGGFGYGPIAYDAAGHMELLGRAGGHDFFYSEIQEYLDTAPHLPDDGVRVSNSPALRYLAAAARGRPLIVYATEITPPIFPDPTPQTLNAMAAINIAEAVANQSIFREKRETPEWATRMYNFLAENEESLIGARLHADVAVIASIHQYLADRQSYAFSASRVLTDNGVGHVFLVDDQIIEEDLSKYSLLILPHLPLLSREKQERLLAYVRAGGTLITMGASGTYDEHNVPLEAAPLALAVRAEFRTDDDADLAVGRGTICYMPIPGDERAFLIEAKEASEFTTFGPSLADRFADIPEGYTRGRIHPDLVAILDTVAGAILNRVPFVSRRLSDHPNVEISTMLNEHAGQVLLHLVNYNVSIYGDVTPARDVAVQISLPPGHSAASVRIGSDTQPLFELPFEVRSYGDRQALYLLVDAVEVYSLVVIDLD